MHNAALAALGREDPAWADWRYFRFDIRPEDLARALALLHAKRFRGVNLTVPHKVLAFDLVGEKDDAARPVGAVNTLLWTRDGWRGFNTDGYGLSAALRSTLGCKLAGQPVVLLGAGGAARGAAIECLQQGCASLDIVNRTPERLQVLLDRLRPLMGAIPVRGFTTESDSFLPIPAEADLPSAIRAQNGAIVINATSAGLRESDAVPVNLDSLPRVAAVYDMIYHPPLTPLLRQAAALGLPHANGLSMLVHQGAKALEIWTGVPAAQIAPIMQAAAEAAARA